MKDSVKALLGRKVGMSQVFSETGEWIPVTLISAEPNIITIRRNEARDGYSAIQLGLNRKKSEVKSHKSKVKNKLTPGAQKKQFAARREFSVEVDENAKTLGVDQFEVGDVVEVSGTSKGKGFAGVVKRHHFKGGPASHGHRHVLRAGGSIGAGYPQHVFKGMRMAGRMGHDRVTVKNLQIVVVDTKKNLLAIRGAVPGPKGQIVEIVSNGKLENRN